MVVTTLVAEDLIDLGDHNVIEYTLVGGELKKVMKA